MAEWTTALPDWERRIVAGESLIPCPPLFPAEAEAALAVFKQLRLVDVLGSPTVGEVTRPWVLDFVAAIFGAYDPDSGQRMIREFFLLISKKNGKSTTAGLIMLTFLILNWRQSGEFGILAPTVEVANNAFKPARDAVKADLELQALFHVQDHIRTITHRNTGASLQVVAADSETVAGKKWIVTLIDELWIFGKRANSEAMFEEATGGGASRPEGCVIYLSTQSDEPPAGVFKKQLDYARGVRDGRIDDPECMPVLYEFPEAMIQSEAYRDPANFYLTNPNLGASVDTKFIERKFRKAGEGGEDSLQMVLSKFLNVEIGQRLASNRWAGADYWERQGTAGLSLESLIKRSEVITVGIDGGGMDDLFSLTVIGRERVTGNWLHWGRSWVNPVALERRKSEASKFLDFQAAGDLVISEAVGDDYSEIATQVAKIYRTDMLESIGVDPGGLGDFKERLEAAGIPGELIKGIHQDGWVMQSAVKTLERRLAEGKFFHGDSPLMAYAVGNAKTHIKGNGTVIRKQENGKAKIDPLMATFDAVALMMMNPESAREYQVFFAG
jgi:phage terminase large subunit-like protein